MSYSRKPTRTVASTGKPSKVNNFYLTLDLGDKVYNMDIFLNVVIDGFAERFAQDNDMPLEDALKALINSSKVQVHYSEDKEDKASVDMQDIKDQL